MCVEFRGRAALVVCFTVVAYLVASHESMHQQASLGGQDYALRLEGGKWGRFYEPTVDSAADIGLESWVSVCSLGIIEYFHDL